MVAFYEQGDFRIDKYHELTLDKAFIDGHYYTDKAPLPALVILPFFGLLKWLGIVQPVEGSFYGPAVYILGDVLCAVIPFVLILLLTFTAIKKHRPALSPVF